MKRQKLRSTDLVDTLLYFSSASLKKPFHKSTTETKISTPPDVGISEVENLPDAAVEGDDENLSSLDENCYLMLEKLNFQEIAAESRYVEMIELILSKCFNFLQKVTQ